MTSRIVRIGRRGRESVQLITTSYTTDPDGAVTEHITLETPAPTTDTQRMRLLKTWEMGKDWGVT